MSVQLRPGIVACCLAGCLTTSLSAFDLNPEDAKVLGRQAALEALYFSLEGDKGRRDAKLAVALVRDPNCELARWHSAHMRWADRWLSLAETEAELAASEIHRDYLKKQRVLSGDPAKEARLARWCAGQSLDDLAEFHFRQVLGNPRSSEKLREDSRRALGLRLQGGAWLTEAQIDQRKRQTQAHQLAERKWSHRVRRWARTLNGQKPKQVQLVRRLMDEVDDLAIISVFERHMIPAGEMSACEFVFWLSRRPQHEATTSLLAISLNAPWDKVKRDAMQSLSERPLHDFIPQLLGQLVPPIESRFTIRVSPQGAVFHRHELHRAGQNSNELARADFLKSQFGVTVREPATPPTTRSRWRISTKPSMLTGRRLSFEELFQELADRNLRTKIMTYKASVRSAQIEQDVAKQNQLVAQHNDRILGVLNGTTEAFVANDPELWWEWWDDYTESHVPPKHTRYSYGASTEFYGPRVYEIILTRLSCFASGTLVRTDAGLHPIESIRPGDRVLSQEIETGELGYKIVKARTERPDAPLLEIVVGDISIHATKGHPFWVNGKGWRMAKKLSVGDVLHTLDGPYRVQEILTKNPQPAYNLILDGWNSYFVGELGVLVHDNQPRQPTLALTPGLLRPSDQ